MSTLTFRLILEYPQTARIRGDVSLGQRLPRQYASKLFEERSPFKLKSSSPANERSEKKTRTTQLETNRTATT
jgi:hypothetical protein